MADELQAFPAIPERLRVAASQGSLIPFIGAGLSKLGGCPDWREFASRCLRFFVDNRKINYSYLEQLGHLSPRVQLSLAASLEVDHATAIDYAQVLKPTDLAAIGQGVRAYSALERLANIFVTTNYDDWLDSPAAQLPHAAAPPIPAPSTAPIIRRNVYYRVEYLSFDRLNTPNSVLHIHGSVRDRKTMVVTTRDYLARYANHAISSTAPKENPYLVFLEELFRLKNVLFIGYGLEELEILEYVIQKARDVKLDSSRDAKGPREGPRHFMLQGFYSHQRDLASSLEKYFAEIGVQLLPFSLDHKNWAQLVDVLEHLAQVVPVGSTLSLQKRAEMRSLLG